MKKLVLWTWFLTMTVGFSQADDFLPSNILMMDAKFTHHVLLVEKATHKLHLYENSDTFPKLVKTYNMATGKFKGDKTASGDHKTPEGIYTIYEFLSKEELLRRHGKYGEIYGAGAFPMDYPNLIDSRAGKSGGGIWLHSTDNDKRIDKGLDSRGCVVLANADLKDISSYLELDRTAIIIVQDIFHLNKVTWERNRRDINNAVTKWFTAWQNKDFENYILAYDEKQFNDKSKGNYNAYKAYKKAVFARPDKPTIKFDFVSILVNEHYAVVTLQQEYHSNVINDTGKKTLYMKKDSNYDWKIVGELWSKVDAEAPKFTPSKRFFKD